MKKTLNLYFILFCCCVTASAQNKHSLKGIIAAMDTLHSRLPAEKLYLHLDKPYYAIGDTLRFKAYLLDDALFGSAKSGLLYVELISDSNRVVKRQTIKVYGGIARGDIVIKRSWYAGNYTLRGYTNWMRNFGQEHFFTKQLNIIPAGNQSWLVNNHITVGSDKRASVDLQFTDHDHKNIGFKEMRLTVLQGTHTLVKSTTRTSPQGNAAVSFSFSENNNEGLSILAEDISKEGKGRKVIIPIALNRPGNIDLQFMPEGGSLVAGISTRVGFKAINEDGLGVGITGKIIDSKQQAVADLQPVHKGMGFFELVPKAGESYSAKVTLPDGGTKTYPLPAVSASGIALKINRKDKDSLEIALNVSTDLLNNNSYYLIGQVRDKVCYGSAIIFKNRYFHQKIAVNIFPTGVIKWILFNTTGQPVAQRLVFIDHDDRLNISLKTDKEVYSLRDSIGLQLAVADVAGKPVSGSFSMAVTDDNLVKPFDTDAENIASYMLLNADLKGNIEDPGYYFNAANTDRSAVLDVLLLTQGWARYDWSNLFDFKPPKYQSESEFTVRGIATNLFNKGLANTDILLISKKPELFMRTKTDTAGRFVFNNFPVLDTIDFHLQADRNFNVGLAVDEFVPPGFKPAKRFVKPWYMNTDSSLINYVNKKQAEQDEILNATKGKLLKTVEIKDKGPYNPWPIPWLDLKEEEIRNARPNEKPLSLMNLLNYKEKIAQLIKLVIVDGKPLKLDNPFYTIEGIAQTNTWLYNFNSEDIKALRINEGRVVVPPVKMIGEVMPPNKVFGYIPPRRGVEDGKFAIQRKGHEEVYLIVNITTNLGRGENASIMGGYVFRPMPISWPHQFYSPRYKVNTPITGRDRRSTVYWSPDVETGEDGKAAGSFFSADRPGTYTLIIEGTDLNGNIGYTRQKIKVGPTTIFN